MANGPLFYPRTFNIENITNANPAVVTTEDPNGYKLGFIVRLYVPPAWGMNEVNDQTVTIIALLSATQFAISLDTTSFNPFVVPPGIFNIAAQVVPVGENTAYALKVGVPILGDATYNTGLF